MPEPASPPAPAAQNPNPTTTEGKKDSSKSPEPARLPEVGDRVWYREIRSDRPAFVANVYKGGELTLAVLGENGQFYVRDHVQRDPLTDDGGIKIQGMWRMKK